MRSARGQLLRSSAAILFLAVVADLSVSAQLSPEANARIKMQAAALASKPSRLELKPQSKGVPAGQAVPVSVTLISADNKPVQAQQDCRVNIVLRLASGATASQAVVISKGKTTASVQLTPDNAGLASVTATTPAGDIRPASTNILVLPSKLKTRPAKKKTAAPANKHSTELISPGLPGTDTRLSHARALQLTAARFELRDSARRAGDDPPAAQPVAYPQLHFAADNAASDYIANGIDAVVISAYYESRDGSPAPRNINIWFTYTRGSLSPAPLQIPKGSYSGSARLTSTWPGGAHIAFVNSNPPYAVEGNTAFDIQFVPLGIVLNAPEKLSVIDDVPVSAVFVNDRGPIAPGKDWPVTFQTSESKVGFSPDRVIVKADSAIGSAVVMPKSVGSDTIEAVVPGYEPKPIKIDVTWKFVLALCLIGGALGGIAAYEQFKGSWFWRIFLGLIGGAFLSWLYVFLALPVTIEGTAVGNIAHNTVSVFFISLLGGYAGLRVIEFAAKKLGLLEGV